MMPFEGGIESSGNGTLILSVAAAVFYAIILDTRSNLLRTLVKTAAVGLLSVLAFMEGGPLLLGAALALCAVGDALLSRDGDRAFLAGLLAFLAGHGVYVGLFLWLAGGDFARASEAWRIGLAGLLAFAAMVNLALLLRRVGPGLRLPILLYTLVVTAMTAASLVQTNPWVTVGALLLLVADALLAVERFLVSSVSPQRGWMRQLSWALYYAGQLIIALGLITLR